MFQIFHVCTETTGVETLGAPWGSHTPQPPPPLWTKPPQLRAWPSNLASSLRVQHDLSQGCQGPCEHTGPAFVYRAKSLSSMQSALAGIRTALFRQGRLCGKSVVTYRRQKQGRCLSGRTQASLFTGMYGGEMHSLKKMWFAMCLLNLFCWSGKNKSRFWESFEK